MHSFVLQERLTVRGPASAGNVTITQPESLWLDVGPFRDLVAWLVVDEVTLPASLGLDYQTAGSKDESLFGGMTASRVAVGLGVTVTKMLAATTTNPLGRWLRWQLVATSPPSDFDVTMRIVVAMNAPSRRSRGFPPETRARAAPFALTV